MSRYASKKNELIADLFSRRNHRSRLILRSNSRSQRRTAGIRRLLCLVWTRGARQRQIRRRRYSWIRDRSSASSLWISNKRRRKWRILYLAGRCTPRNRTMPRLVITLILTISLPSRSLRPSSCPIFLTPISSMCLRCTKNA